MLVNKKATEEGYSARNIICIRDPKLQGEIIKSSQ